MENRHVKLDYQEAIFAKKHFLSSELNFLQAMKKIRVYRLLRKREIIQRNKLKLSLKVLKSKLKFIESTFPKEHISKVPRAKMKKLEIKQNEEIKRQLDEIREELAKLG